MKANENILELKNRCKASEGKKSVKSDSIHYSLWSEPKNSNIREVSKQSKYNNMVSVKNKTNHKEYFRKSSYPIWFVYIYIRV